MLGAKQLSKEKIEALEKLLAPLEQNMGEMKEEHIKSVKADEEMSKTLRGTKDTAQGQQMEKFSGVFTHMYEKDRAFGHSVTGMLRKAIHFLKKGDNSGIEDLVKNMGQITR